MSGSSLGPRPSRPHSDGHRFWHRRGYLPHFDAGAVVQSITFRLADSLPAHVYDSILACSKTGSEQRARIEALIDRERGACVLRRTDCASIVENALRYFDGDRYRLLAWVIMPNHVHVLIEQIEGYRLSDVVHAWKSYTANRINKIVGQNGALWAPDYFDRFIRNEGHYASAVSYIECNPLKAGLIPRAEDWPFSSLRQRFAEPS
jgi:REP element-mobilizing transposase RayT